MKKAVMEKWVKALRSGKFKQGRGRLDTGEGYCCLGVLCVLAEREGVRVERERLATHRVLGGVLKNQPAVRSWAGLKSEGGDFKLRPSDPKEIRVRDCDSLVSLNDTTKWSFRKIASFVEKNWRRL